MSSTPEGPDLGSPASSEPSPSESRWGVGGILLPVGVILTLCGLIGDLVVRGGSADAQHEVLVSFGAGLTPWHVVLFAGVVLTAVGVIRRAVRQRSDWGGFLGAVIAMLLVAAVVVGVYAVVRGPAEEAGTPTSGASASAPPEHEHDQAAGLSGHHHAASGAGSGGAGVVGSGHTHGTPGPVSPEQATVLAKQLKAAKRATSAYRDIAAARAAGYIKVTQFIPGLGLHLVNLAIPDDRFDPARPQILLYQPVRSGRMKLVGVAYEFRHTTDRPPAGFAGGSDVWHYHTDLCFLPGGVVTVAGGDADCKAAGGVLFQKQTAWLLHAWLWKDNPKGVFTEINPTVS